MSGDAADGGAGHGDVVPGAVPDGVRTDVPVNELHVPKWVKPIPLSLLGRPSIPPTFCGREASHRAHMWDEVAPEHQVVQWTGRLEDIPAQVPLVRYWCEGWGHLRGYL